MFTMKKIHQNSVTSWCCWNERENSYEIVIISTHSTPHGIFLCIKKLVRVSMSSNGINRNIVEGKRLWYIILHANLTLYNFIFIYHEFFSFYSSVFLCHFYEYAMLPVLAAFSFKLKFNGIKFSLSFRKKFCLNFY